MLIRSCDSLDRLHEYNLLILVIINTPPNFISELKTEFHLKVGQKHTYTLPEVKDREENDESEVYIGFMEGERDLFPPFCTFNNNTNVIVLEPHSKTFAGRIYQFTIVVKEKNSDFNKFVYPASVTVESLDPSEEIKESAQAREIQVEQTTQDDSSMAIVLIKTVISSFFSFEL